MNQLDEGEWDSTDKHRVMFVIKKSKLEELGHESRHELWRHGRLHFVQSAPRAAYARWRMKVAPDLDVKHRIKTFDDDGQPVTRLLTTQDVFFGILLSWWERTQKGDPHHFFRGNFGVKKGVPNEPF